MPALNVLNYFTYGLGAILILVGLFLFFYKPKNRSQKREMQKVVLHNNLSLKDKIDIINGKNSFGTNAIKNYFFDVKLILAKMNKVDAYPKIRLLAIIIAMAVLIACFAIDNPLIAIVLVPVGFIIPFQLVKIRYRKYNKKLEEELETALSLITISYTRTTNLLQSVNECMDTLPPTVKPYFEDFYFEATSVSASLATALVNLKTKIENRTFQQWVDRVLVCLNDRSSIPSLQNYVNEFADNRAIQDELDAEVFSCKVEMYMMIGFVFFTPVLLYFLQKEAVGHLFHDTPGKIAVFVALLLVVVVFFAGNHIAKPVKFRGNKD